MSRVYVRLFNFYYSFAPFPHVIEEMLPPPSSRWCWHTEMTVVICPHHSSAWQHSCPCGRRWSTEKLLICSAPSGDSVPTFVMSLGLGAGSKWLDLSRVTADSFDQLGRNLSSWKVEPKKNFLSDVAGMSVASGMSNQGGTRTGRDGFELNAQSVSVGFSFAFCFSEVFEYSGRDCGLHL